MARLDAADARFSDQATRLSRSRRKARGLRLVDGALVVSPLESEVPEAAEALKWELTASYPTSTLRICSPRSMVGPCWPTPPISAPSAWRKPHPMSANDRLVGRVCSMSGRRLTKRRKQRLSTRIQPIHTPLFGAPARHRLPTGSSSAPATAPQVEAT